jgi:hypothetical protein
VAVTSGLEPALVSDPESARPSYFTWLHDVLSVAVDDERLRRQPSPNSGLSTPAGFQVLHRQAGRVVLRCQPRLRHAPEVTRAHARRKARAEAVAVDQPLRLRVAADDVATRLIASSSHAFRVVPP